MDRCCMLCQVLCVGRVKILHVTSWAMAGVRTGVILHVTSSSLCWSSKDITCYVEFFVLTEYKCYMLRHGIWLQLGQMLHVTLSCLC
jgi:hypothetical protein